MSGLFQTNTVLSFRKAHKSKIKSVPADKQLVIMCSLYCSEMVRSSHQIIFTVALCYKSVTFIWQFCKCTKLHTNKYVEFLCYKLCHRLLGHHRKILLLELFLNFISFSHFCGSFSDGYDSIQFAVRSKK